MKSSKEEKGTDNIGILESLNTGEMLRGVGKSNKKCKPWRKSREEVLNEQAETSSILESTRSGGASCSSSPVHCAAIVFCYEADSLIDQLESPLSPAEQSAREAVDNFRMVATNRSDDSNEDLSAELEAARKLAAQRLKDIGLESAMRNSLKKAPAGKWPVMHEIVRGLWCGGWTALNDNCRALEERGIRRVVSVVSAEKRRLPPHIVQEHLHIQAHDSLDAQLLHHFPRICAFVEAAREENAPVFVHCGAGISRAPTAVVACLMWRYRLPAKDALRQMKKARPSARPNVNFVQQLVNWEHHVSSVKGLVNDILICNGDDCQENSKLSI